LEADATDRETLAEQLTLSLVINWVATDEKTAVFILYSQGMADDHRRHMFSLRSIRIAG
jgi:hypothetical protein